jgi:hypothetical protein
MLQDLYQNCSISNRIVVAESPSQHQNGKYYELEENHRLECLCLCVIELRDVTFGNLSFWCDI